MRTMSRATISAEALVATAADYSARGWEVATTTNGISLITDENICGIEVPGELTADVRHFMTANNLLGPVIEIPGANRREIYLVTGIKKADLAIAALRDRGITVHMDGASIALPPTKLSAGCATWAVAPEDARWTPPVVAVGAAVRAVTSPRYASVAERVAS